MDAARGTSGACSATTSEKGRPGAISILVDAGVLYANVDASDEHHAAARHLFERFRGPLLVPVLVVAEVTYLLGSRLGVEAEIRFLGDLTLGNFIVEDVHAADWMRIAALVAQYRDLPLGTADASIVAAAERLKVTSIATFDHRHFSVVRASHVDSFELLP